MPTPVPTAVLVARARDGDRTAWDEIVERYAALVWSVCRRYGLSRHDTDDVGQSVWLRLVEHLPRLREPAALPGWLSTTTQRECIRVLRGMGQRARWEPIDSDEQIPADRESTMVERGILAEERNAALREAFAALPARCQELLSLLMADPPVSYVEISERINIPVGGIGPNRGRCLERLRRSPVLAALTGDAAEEAGRGRGT